MSAVRIVGLSSVFRPVFRKPAFAARSFSLSNTFDKDVSFIFFRTRVRNTLITQKHRSDAELRISKIPPVVVNGPTALCDGGILLDIFSASQV